jgi:hypothetical protein
LAARGALKQTMSWHDPELYLFLCVLAVFTALLAITYELVSRRRKPPLIPTEEKPLDGLNESGPWSKPMIGVADLALPASMPDSRQVGEQEAEQELARRAALLRRFQNVHARDRRNDDSPVYLKNVRPLEGLVRNRPLPSEERQAAGNCEGIKDVPPKEQASRVRDHFGNFAGARPVSPRR